MELALVLTGIMALFGFGMFAVYKSDPVGWKQTFRRISNGSRAAFEGVTQEDWDRQFEGKELEPLKTKHVLARTYVTGSVYQYCHWVCKCGVSGYKRTEFSGAFLRRAQRNSLKDAARHIKAARIQERKNPDGSFTF